MVVFLVFGDLAAVLCIPVTSLTIVKVRGTDYHKFRDAIEGFLISRTLADAPRWQIPLPLAPAA